MFATGSESHLRALQALARKSGFKLDQKGLHRNRTVIGQTEEEIYSALGLDFIPPELRETGDEVTLAASGKLPKLVTQEDIHGVLHAHTDQSDGTESLDSMVSSARKRGYAYFGLTDHSQTAHYAGGLKPDELLAQTKAVDRLNKKLGKSFHVFKGTESDILGDGSLDFPGEVLQKLDLVVASVHSKFRMDKREQTKRILKAIANPF